DRRARRGACPPLRRGRPRHSRTWARMISGTQGDARRVKGCRIARRWADRGQAEIRDRAAVESWLGRTALLSSRTAGRAPLVTLPPFGRRRASKLRDLRAERRHAQLPGFLRQRLSCFYPFSAIRLGAARRRQYAQTRRPGTSVGPFVTSMKVSRTRASLRSVGLSL